MAAAARASEGGGRKKKEEACEITELGDGIRRAAVAMAMKKIQP